MMLRSAYTLVALVGYASAAQLNGTSASCTSALTFIVGNGDAAKCLDATAFVAVVAAATSSSPSLISTLDNWFKGLCSASPCSNDTIAGVVQNITTGCAAELKLIADTSSIPNLTETAQQVYPVLREVVCLRNGTNNCVVQLLTSIQNTFGPITNISYITNLVKTVKASGLPSNITCTDCVKEAYNLANKSLPTVVAELGPPLQSQCGASFIDGETPSGITESASNITGAPSSAFSIAFGGVSHLSHGIIFGLVVISAMSLLL